MIQTMAQSKVTWWLMGATIILGGGIYLVLRTAEAFRAMAGA